MFFSGIALVASACGSDAGANGSTTTLHGNTITLQGASFHSTDSAFGRAIKRWIDA